MKIDIISDTVCPWCLIGKRKLETALAQRPGLDVDITWHPFQLHPDMPPGGADRKEFTASKFGSVERAREIYANIQSAGETLDLAFEFGKIKRSPNTLDSHRLLRWSESTGLQDKLVEVLFRKFFMDGQDLGDQQVLLDAAEEVGMDKVLVTELLESDKDKELVLKEEARAREMGVTGVPFFVFNDKYALSGAQDPSAFLQVFDQIAQEASNEASAAE